MFEILEEQVKKFEDHLQNGSIAEAEQLILKFPQSARRKRLEGKLHEAKGEYQAALDIYAADSSPEAFKQKAMCLYGKGDWEEGIQALLQYLDTWMGMPPILILGDADAWYLLSKFYKAHSMPKQAAFALEEVLMLRPDKHQYLLAYADLVLQLGDEDLACKNYCAALEICDCIHGWYGVYHTTKVEKLKALAKKKLEDAVKAGKKSDLLVKFIASK